MLIVWEVYFVFLLRLSIPMRVVKSDKMWQSLGRDRKNRGHSRCGTKRSLPTQRPWATSIGLNFAALHQQWWRLCISEKSWAVRTTGNNHSINQVLLWRRVGNYKANLGSFLLVFELQSFKVDLFALKLFLFSWMFICLALWIFHKQWKLFIT
jgi:hypothetical protein